MGKVQGSGAVGQILIGAKAVSNKIEGLSRLSRPDDVVLDIDEIRGGGADEQFRRALRVAEVKRKAISEIDKWLSDEVNGLIDRARQYMVEHGPQSFVLLCKGIDSELAISFTTFPLSHFSARCRATICGCPST